MRIAVDAMGSDFRPVPDVAGAVAAAREFGDNIILVGREDMIRKELNRHDLTGIQVEVVGASDEILMTEKPSIAVRNKSNSSIHVGMRLVKDQEVDAFVSAGNTGAVHAVATLHTLKRIPGVKRPALSSIFPVKGSPVIFLDIGANTDSRSDWLVQFAIMGSIYAENALGLAEPRIGLLSNGEEESKGNQLVLETHKTLQSSKLHYVGNVEPGDILTNCVDVVVCDGFVGNILLKTFEASTRYLADVIRDELKADVFSSIGGLLARHAFRRARERLDTSEIGGAPLLGVNGVVIISHGRSSASAIKNAINQARLAVMSNVIQAIEDGLAEIKTV